MLFSGIPFLYYFLPCVLALYFPAPRKLKNLVLLISSLVFYGWGEPRYIWLMLGSILCGYISGLLIERFREKAAAKGILIGAVLVSLGLLGYFKYAGFFVENFNAVTGLSLPLLNIALPIGISFYTFQILSYVIDVYRGDVRAQRNLIHLAAYISLFPQLIAGPIVRYSDVANQLEYRTHSLSKAASGIRIFILGLGKKLLIANVLGELCTAYTETDEKTVLFSWMYAAAYALQIYFDFSGYSDMAVGLGRLLGFEFVENFRYPFISGSITEFWRRWHISLGTWFRDYVYIPLGGSRVSVFRRFRNLLIVWMLTGLWHGAAWCFILWGLYFAVLLMVEKRFLLKRLEKAKIFRHVYVLLAVLVSFVIFSEADTGMAAETLKGMFGLGGMPLISHVQSYYLRSFGLVLLAAVLGATPIPRMLAEKMQQTRAGAVLFSIAEPVVLGLLLLTATSYLVDGSFNPFLYFRF